MFKNRIDEFVIPQIMQVNEDGKRTYKTPSGKNYPSLTGVTGLLGREGIKAWRARVGEAEAKVQIRKLIQEKAKEKILKLLKRRKRQFESLQGFDLLSM